MKLNIFFDESGKKGTPPMLMGAISIVDKIYTNDIFNEINDNLRENKIKYHFTKYNGNRGEKFSINSCLLVPKNQQIGVELCDIVLGIIRVILDFEKINSSMTNTYLSKVKLVNEILAITHVYEFFSNIKYFEWDNIQSLKEIKFKDYLDTYRAICSDI